MSHIVEDTGLALGRRIRLERQSRGWSLAQLAEHSGVSRAAIGKIENGLVSPTAALLVKLVGAFDLTLAGFFIRAEGGERLSRIAEQPVWQDPETGYTRRQVFALAGHPIELVRVEFPPRATVRLPASSYARIRQVLWLLEGELVVIEGEERSDLGAGDCLGFGSPSEVTLRNENDRAALYLVAISRS